MKIARFSHGDTIAFGIVDEEEHELVVLKSDPLFAGFETTGERVALAEAKLLAPVIPRSKVVAVGKNYHDHAADMAATRFIGIVEVAHALGAVDPGAQVGRPGVLAGAGRHELP